MCRLDRYTCLAWLALGFFLVFINSNAYGQTEQIPTFSIQMGESEHPQDIAPAIKIVLMLTILSVAPAILLMMTSFTRIIIVLGFVRQALGTQTMPPNQVLIGLSLFLTFFTMSPIIDVAYQKAFIPYQNKDITMMQALDIVQKPVRSFMLAETREEDLRLLLSVSTEEKPSNSDEIKMITLIPAFMVSELRTAFQIGFLIYIPFLIVDMVVSAVLMAMGMLMLPPTVVSLPFKIVLFILVDGWALIVESLVRSFKGFAL